MERIEKVDRRTGGGLDIQRQRKSGFNTENTEKEKKEHKEGLGAVPEWDTVLELMQERKREQSGKANVCKEVWVARSGMTPALREGASSCGFKEQWAEQ